MRGYGGIYVYVAKPLILLLDSVAVATEALGTLPWATKRWRGNIDKRVAVRRTGVLARLMFWRAEVWCGVGSLMIDTKLLLISI